MPTPFSERLSARRAALSRSPEALAGQLRISVKTLSRWESGRAFPPLAKLPLLAKALDCPLDGLLAGTPAEAAALLVARAQREKRAAVLRLSRKYVPNASDSAHSAEADRFWASLCMLELVPEQITGKQAKELAGAAGD